MLRRIRIENFKAWAEIDIVLAPISGFFGSNSSGKSSIFQFLLLLKQTKNATDRSISLDFGGPDQLINLGSFTDAVHNHDVTKTISWKLRWDLPKKISITDASRKRTELLATASQITHISRVHIGTKRSLVSDCLEYWFGDYKFVIRSKKEGSPEFDLVVEKRKPEAQEFRFVRNQARIWAVPGPIKTHLFPDQAKTYFKNSDFLGVFEAEYESFMDSIFYLGPLREYPRREYPWSGVSPSDVGRRGERTVEAILAATAREEKRNLGKKTRYKSFQEMIAYWLKRLGLIEDFKVEEIGSGANLYRTVVRKSANSPPTLLTDVGIGVSQVLPALVLLYYVPEGSIVLLEQPEIHLHPAVQSSLADLLIEVAATRKLQVLVESHSEHLLRRLQRRIAEEAIDDEDVKIFFTETDQEKSVLKELQIDEYGYISNWPKDFFGDEMTEIAETQKAALKRKLRTVPR